MLIERIEQLLRERGINQEVIRVIRKTLDSEASKLYQKEPKYTEDIVRILESEVNRK